MQKAQSNDWQIVGWVILSIRFVQGWIFWGGGSRRFIYAPEKLDPYASQWMANKLQSAMPGALFGTGEAISFLLHHFYLLYGAIIAFSLVELVVGVALITGFFTRAAGFISVLLSISLMLIFGWEGSTCLDEWTMAVSNLAMGFAIFLAGSPLYSVDSWLIHRYPNRVKKHWFLCLASGPWQALTLKRVAIACAIFTIIFTVGTYNYYRGAILSRYHAGPVSAVLHHMTLSEGHLKQNGSVTFTMYVDAGNTAIPSSILKIELKDEKGQVIEAWTGKDLSQLPLENIQNDYLYNRIMPGPFGIEAPVSARAVITLLPTNKSIKIKPGAYMLWISTVQGHEWKLMLTYTGK